MDVIFLDYPGDKLNETRARGIGEISLAAMHDAPGVPVWSAGSRRGSAAIEAGVSGA